MLNCLKLTANDAFQLLNSEVLDRQIDENSGVFFQYLPIFTKFSYESKPQNSSKKLEILELELMKEASKHVSKLYVILYVGSPTKWQTKRSQNRWKQ